MRIICVISSTVLPGSAAPGQGGLANPRLNGAQGVGRGQEGPNGVNGVDKGEILSPTDEELEVMRDREIAGKAITGSLILLLKWFKLSRTFLRRKAIRCSVESDEMLTYPSQTFSNSSS
jgi:hypothetical protein